MISSPRLLSYLRPQCSSVQNEFAVSKRKCSSQKITSKDPEIKKYVKRQMTDRFSKLAQAHNYRARSAFKLLEMNEKLRIVRPGDFALDVGAAPGSWCQVLSELIFCEASKSNSGFGYILGVDLQPILPIENVDLLPPADITRRPTQDEIRRRLNGREFDVIVSDMAPNCTGNSVTDHHRIISLCRCVLNLITSVDSSLPLVNDGKFLCKIWDGQLNKEFVKEIKEHFRSVKIVKPVSSRSNSSEIYLYANGFLKPI